MKRAKTKTIVIIQTLVMMLVLLLTHSSIAQEKPVESESEKMARIAAETNNPVGDLWMLFIQNDFTVFSGDFADGRRILNSFKFQPVIPLRLSKGIKMIVRPVFQFQSWEIPKITPTGTEWQTKNGLGDMVLLSAFAPAKASPYIWGIGPTWILPTATSDALGGEKWAVGPAVVAFYLGPKWVIGVVGQHWWDIGGDDDRGPIKLTDIQYVIRYKVNPFFQIGTGPNFQYNWETEQAAVPIGIGMDVTTKWGETIFRWGFDVEYYLSQNDNFGQDWNFRLFFIPVIGAPF